MSENELENRIRKEIKNLIAQGKHVVTKVWGYEYWVDNNESYCGKILYLLPGYQSSLHRHTVKKETFMCLEGLVMLQWIDNDTGEFEHEVLRPWCKDRIRLLPGTAHRFWAMEGPAIVVEFSTPHDDDDVTRLEDSCER